MLKISWSGLATLEKGLLGREFLFPHVSLKSILLAMAMRGGFVDILLNLAVRDFNSHMHEIFLQRYCMKWVPGNPLKEMIN